MPPKLSDINTESDVVRMVDTFYSKVQADELIGPVFNDIAGVDWGTHLPKMYRFWNSLIFGTGTYKGRPFPPHTRLPIDATHFSRWLSLFEETVDELFTGEVAAHTKLRAKSIAHIFQSKLAFLKSDKP